MNGFPAQMFLSHFVSFIRIVPARNEELLDALESSCGTGLNVILV
jgi:hypothetical protein